MLSFCEHMVVAAILNTLSVTVFVGEFLLLPTFFVSSVLEVQCKLNSLHTCCFLLPIQLQGLNEVAKELEEPFRNAPNDLRE